MIDGVEAIADRIMIMKEGNIIGNDTVSNLKASVNSDSSLEDLFLEMTRDE